MSNPTSSISIPTSWAPSHGDAANTLAAIADTVGDPIKINHGGTGADTASGARTSLGVDTAIAESAASTLVSAKNYTDAKVSGATDLSSYATVANLTEEQTTRSSADTTLASRCTTLESEILSTHFGTETTTAATLLARTATGNDTLDYDKNPTIRIMMSFAAGNDNRTLVSGSTVTYQNTIEESKAYTLSYNNGTAYPIKGGRGEYLGIGAWGANELLILTFVGTSSAGGYWYCENAKSIMQGGDSTNGYYTKYTNGKIEQRFAMYEGAAGTYKLVTYPISFSSMEYTGIACYDNTITSYATAKTGITNRTKNSCWLCSDGGYYSIVLSSC